MPKYIPLTKDQAAIVDDEDYDWLTQWKWHYSAGYAMRKQGGPMNQPHTTVMMHRAILPPPPGLFVDHINMNRLDNRRCNLRVCTAAQNNYNRNPHRTKSATSQFKGVRFYRPRNKWHAFIVLEKGRQTHLGYFLDEVEAARAYDAAARAHFGEFARTNFND